LSFLLAITDYSPGEGIYTSEQAVKLAARLGYDAVALWDTGLHGWPALREAAMKIGIKPLIGARFNWRGSQFGALPWSDSGYAQLCRLLTDLAHERDGELPTKDCSVAAMDLPGAELLAEQGIVPTLLAHRRNGSESMQAIKLGINVICPQVLRCRTSAGLELHRLKRAIETCDLISRTELHWHPEDAALPRCEWASRFPACDQGIARNTDALLERLAAWEPHWETWVMPEPLAFDGDLYEELMRRAAEGLAKRNLQNSKEAKARLSMELDLIRRKRFAGYFLAVHDIFRKAKVSRTCGRGSGAASLVSYALGITNVDPIATNLMFERFLSEARQDPPDLDIDFAWDERDAVIQSVFEAHGREHVAMVSNHVFFKPRSALRAVAQAHGRPEPELKTLARLVRGWDGGLVEAAAHPQWTPLIEQAKSIIGHFNQLSVHPGGTVITPCPLWRHVPFQPAPAKEGVSITHWDKDGVEGYGLVKIDLLGNRSLAVVRDALVDLGYDRSYHWNPRVDPETQGLLSKGDSIGVFYVESPATRQLQQRVGRGDFETLVMHSSLIRPAAHHWIDTYVKRIRGEEAYAPSHPVLGELLSESYGVLVYQEDVVRVGMAMAGWGHQEADKLRKLLGKLNCHRDLPAFEARFRQGCAANGIPESVIAEVWSMIQTFQGYSFCKPHSASYAQVSFESAWIKAHHPAQFFASVITNQGGFYPAVAYLGDARRHRLVVRGPDANKSQYGFSAEGEQGLRVGLMAIKGAIKHDIDALLENREKNGQFESLEDLLGRVPLSVDTAVALASAGTFDLWAQDGDRTRLAWAAFGGVPKGVRPKPTDPFQRAGLEMEIMGFPLEMHPAMIARVKHGGGPNRTADAEKPNRRLKMWALVVAEKPVPTKHGDMMQFVTLEDEIGLLEAVAFPDAFRRRKRPYRVGEVVPVAGTSTRQDGLVVLQLGG
jgi:DNA-directed DNA polymerase III PolC